MPFLPVGLHRFIRTSLARRAAVIIIWFCALVGIAAALVSVALVRQEARARIELSLSQLIDTIDRPARIAAFTSDAALAHEVAAGLQHNRFVSHVVIYAGPDVLVDAGRGKHAGIAMTRSLISPFDDNEVVGRIVITPDNAAIEDDVATVAGTIALLLALMVSALSASVTWVVQFTITRPIKAVSDALHRLDAQGGERLPSPSGNESNELGRLVEDVNALVDRVVRRERIFRGIVSQALDAITLIDIEADRFVEFNESAHADLGLTRERFAALSAADLLFPKHARATNHGGITPWTNQVYEIRCVTPAAESVDLRVSTRLISLDDRPYAVCTWTNITSQKAVQDELRHHRDGLQELVNARTRDLLEAKESAEHANRAKSEFLSNMSHELRTPMHAILSFARLGADRADKAAPDKLRHYFRSVHNSGERLMELLNDLLDLSKLEAGMMRLDSAREDLGQIVTGVIDEFTPLAREKGLTLHFESTVDDASLTCDAVRVRQVLNNLLSNAVKFTATGGRIDLQLSDAQLPGPSPALALSVSDQGIGIPEDELEKVFDKFVQSSKTRSGAGGTGLGLSITREIVALHGGTIAARNNPQGGARFTLVLPREPAPEESPETVGHATA